MNRTDRYVLRELLVPTFAGTVLIAFLFAGNELIALFQQLTTSNVPALVLAKLVLLRMPFWLTFTLPTGLAMGCSLAVSRLLREGELTAMRAAGISLKRSLRIVGLVGLVFAGITFYLSEFVVPVSTKEHAKLGAETYLLGSRPSFENNVIIKLPPYVATFREVLKASDDSLILKDVLLIKMDTPDEALVFSAKDGTYKNGVWRFPAPRVWVFGEDSLTSFDEEPVVVINQRIDVQDMMPGALPEYKSMKELWDSVVAQRATKGEARRTEVQFYTRFAVPAACFVFAIGSTLLSLRFSKASAFQGLLMSLAMALGYYNLHMIATTIVGPNGWLPPMWATWSPVILCGVFALLAMRKIE